MKDTVHGIPNEQDTTTQREVKIGNTVFHLTTVFKGGKDFEKVFMDWAMDRALKASYDFPAESGEFIGTLVMKKWSDSNGLICYFETEQGEKLKLCVWFKANAARTYRPTQSTLDISMVDLGTKILAKYAVTEKGKTRWEQAEIM